MLTLVKPSFLERIAADVCKCVLIHIYDFGERFRLSKTHNVNTVNPTPYVVSDY